MAYAHRPPLEPDDRLFVVNGALRGVSVPLDVKSMRVGFSEDCDVLLVSESADADTKADLTLGDDNSLSISPIRGRVSLGGRHLKAARDQRMTRLKSLSIGDVDLIIARSLVEADGAVRSEARRSTGMAWAASLAVALGAIGFVGLSSGSGASKASAKMVFASVGAAPQFSAVPALAADTLRDRLDSAGLSRLSTSANLTARTVSVRGRLRESETEAWAEVRAWFDATYGASVQMDAQLTEIAESVTLPFMIEAVWLSGTPRVTLHDGSQRQPGDLLPGGWRLDAVAMDTVQISKDGETLRVPL